jgi:hypothetical protein
MALGITYLWRPERQQWISLSNVAYNSAGVGFPDLDFQVTNSAGTPFTVFYANWDLPPFEPDFEDEAEVARAIAAGRYFICEPEQRVFVVSKADGNRTFYV